MPGLPSNVLLSTVMTRFLHASIDGPDSDTNPEGDPWINLSVRFTASTAIMKNRKSDPPTWITLDSIEAKTDLQGYLVNPADGKPGIVLVSTDNPDLGDGEDWWWTVDISGVGFPGLSFNFLAPANATIDLTKVAPIPAGIIAVLPEWQRVLARIEELTASIPGAILGTLDE
jgi:hypothetical protein